MSWTLASTPRRLHSSHEKYEEYRRLKLNMQPIDVKYKDDLTSRLLTVIQQNDIY